MMAKVNTGARYEIAIDGTPRTYRDIAMAAATHLKTKQPQSEVTIRDLENGKVTSVKHPLEKKISRPMSPVSQ